MKKGNSKLCTMVIPVPSETPDINMLLNMKKICLAFEGGRGGSRGRQTSHATNVKIANLIKVLNILPIVQLFFIMRHLIIVQYLLSCSASN